MNKALLSLGHSVELDQDDSSVTVLKTGFASSDQAVKIGCAAKIQGGITAAPSCQVEIDGAKSVAGITHLEEGKVGNALIATINYDKDAQRLTQSIARPLGFFQSSEKVDVRLANGKVVKLSRFELRCGADPQAYCSVSLLP